MNKQTFRAGIDRCRGGHCICIGLPDSKLIDEFEINH